MPNSYTHQLIAEDALADIGGITCLPMYFFGAQGPDPMFFYRYFAMRKVSPGKLLHREHIRESFAAMSECARSRPETLDYILGYISHYAADTVFHPFVYYIADVRGGTGMDRNITHTRVERDLDTYFLSLRGVRMHRYSLPFSEKDVDTHIVAAVMGAALGGMGLAVREHDVERAVSRYFRYIRGTYDGTGMRRRVSDVMGGIGIKPFSLLGALFSRDVYDVRSLNLGRSEWHFIDDPLLTRTDSADDLYARAVKRSSELADIFRFCTEMGSELPEELFALNFLTGRREELGDVDAVYGKPRNYYERLKKYLEK